MRLEIHCVCGLLWGTDLPEKEDISEARNILRAWGGKSIKEFNSAKIRSLTALCPRQLMRRVQFENLIK